MIKCISYWSTPKGLENAEPIESAAKLAKDAGFEGIELAIGADGVIHTRSTQAECERARDAVRRAGLSAQTAAAGLTWGCSPTSDDAAVRRRSIELHAAALQRAAWLGAEAMLMVPGVVTSPIAPAERVPYEAAVERVREAVKQLLDTAEKVGVDLCLENVWNGLFLSPLEWRDFIDSFGSQRLGMYFDVGNLLGYHQWPPHWITLLGKRIKRVHIKGFKDEFGFDGRYAFCGLLEGDVPWAQTMAALRGVGYDRTLVAEMLPWKPGLLEQTSRDMDQIIAMQKEEVAA